MTDHLKTMASDNRLGELMERHIAGVLTRAERLELMLLWLDPSQQPELSRLIDAAWEITGDDESLTDESLKMLFEKAFEKKQATPVVPITAKKNKWNLWMAAASVLLLIGFGGFLLWSLATKQKTPVQHANQDLRAPVNSKATITLSDGQKIYLDSMNNGMLVKQGNSKVLKLADGQIAYQKDNGEIVKEVQYNTLHNPIGSTVINMQLADGSRMWLNAGSSVTYPVAFTGDERNVSINGEAYFEVAPDKTKPFHVKVNDIDVAVLGTHFNINSYADEPAVKITLLEGRVMVQNSLRKVYLNPGQQVKTNASQMQIVDDVDTEEVMAWKNGVFHFNRADIEYIMRQVGRWYNVKVVFEGKMNTKSFSGIVSRNNNVSDLLKIMEGAGVKFRVEADKITVVQN